MAILSNELVRRLSTIHRDVVREEIAGVIETYISQLNTSGYGRKQTREIVICGVVGWRRKLERKEKDGGKQYQEAKDTLASRNDAKLLEKTTWYRGNLKRKKENQESTFQYRPATKRRRKEVQIKGGKGGTKDIKSVMFVPILK